MFDENTLPYVSPKQSQTNINVSFYLDTFVKSFSKLHAYDNYDSGEYRLLAHTLLVIKLLHLMYSLKIRVLLTS